MSQEHFDQRWETQVYGAGKHLNRFPHNEVVSFVLSNYSSTQIISGKTALDIGCGAGNNTVFLAELGFKVTSIDGSTSAVEVARQRIQEHSLAAEIHVGDFTDLSKIKDGTIDLIIDRCSICHCRRSGIEKALNEVKRVLKPDGLFFSQMFSDVHSEAKNAAVIEDGTVIEFSAGYFADIAQTYFASEGDIDQLYRSRFNILSQTLVTSKDWLSPETVACHWNLYLCLI